MLHTCERVRVRVGDHFLTIWHPDVPRNRVRANFFVARGRDRDDSLGMRGGEAGKACLFLTLLVILIVSFMRSEVLRALMSDSSCIPVHSCVGFNQCIDL